MLNSSSIILLESKALFDRTDVFVVSHPYGVKTVLGVLISLNKSLLEYMLGAIIFFLLLYHSKKKADMSNDRLIK